MLKRSQKVYAACPRGKQSVFVLAINTVRDYNKQASRAGVMESADVLDSKSSPGNRVRVRPPPPAPGPSSQASYRLRRLFCFAPKVISHSFRCSSFPDRTRCAGIRFGILEAEKEHGSPDVSGLPGRFVRMSGFRKELQISLYRAMNSSRHRPLSVM